MERTQLRTEAIVAELIGLGRACHQRGWALATSGNFSARVDSATIAITASGRNKGALTPEDILLVDRDGRLTDAGSGRPSAETPLHCQLYRSHPTVGAVAHTHSRAGTVLSRRAVAQGVLVLEGYEMVKALAGVASHEHTVRLPILANSEDTTSLARDVKALLATQSPVHGYLIAGHGLYTWGADIDEVMRHVEALEFMLECHLLEARLS